MSQETVTSPGGEETEKAGGEYTFGTGHTGHCRQITKTGGAAADMGLILGCGRSPGGGHGSPLQYSFWENPMDRGAWWATVHRVTKSQTRLK